MAAEGPDRILLNHPWRALRLPQVVCPDLLPGVADLFRVIERDSGMNPTIRAVTDPMAFRRKVDLIALIRVPDRFAAPIHRLSASKAGPSKRPLFSLRLCGSVHMTLISLSAKIISGHFGSGKNPEAFVRLSLSRLIPLCRSLPGTPSEELPFPPCIRRVLFCHNSASRASSTFHSWC